MGGGRWEVVGGRWEVGGDESNCTSIGRWVEVLNCP